MFCNQQVRTERTATVHSMVTHGASSRHPTTHHLDGHSLFCSGTNKIGQKFVKHKILTLFTMFMFILNFVHRPEDRSTSTFWTHKIDATL